MKANLWTKLFAIVIVAGSFIACGVEETRLAPVSDDEEFQPSTGDSDSGTDTKDPAPDSSTTEEPTDDAGTTEEPTDDAGTTEEPTDDAGTTEEPTNVDVARSTANCYLELSTLYVAGATAGEIRGNIPGIATWSSGPVISDDDADGYLDFVPVSLPVGSFDFSYVSSDGTWALYGAKEQLRSMTAAARSFVSCNWFDGVSEVAASAPECHLRLTVAADCAITGAGNMANFQ